MNIEIDQYISEEDKKQIALDVWRSHCQKRSAEDFERIINNSAYHVIWKAVDEVMDQEVDSILRDKVVEIIKSMTVFNVFSKPNAWDRQENQAYGVLMEVVRENKPTLDSAVKFGMDNMTRKQKADLAFDLAKSSINK